MSVLMQMQEILPELSKNERKVADYLLQSPRDLQRFSCEAIANACGTSRSAVIRLCQKLGYHGYAEFKYAVMHDPTGILPPTQTNSGVLELYCQGFLQLQSLVDSDLLREVSEAIIYANRVITVGYLHSSFSAKQLAFRLNRSSIDSHALDDISLLELYTEILKAGDVVIFFSISGLELYEDIALALHQKRVKVVLVTMSPLCRLAKLVNHVISLPLIGHTYRNFTLDDAVTFYLFIELLIEDIHKKLAHINSPSQEDTLSYKL